MVRRGKAVLYKIHQVRVMNPNDKAAKNILNVAAREVEPIMQKRQWQVLVLEEFCPTDRRFVGLYIRSESEIKLRLRTNANDKYMFHYDFIIGSLLHELAHIQYSSHGPRFYALLNKLKHEYNMLYCTRVGRPIANSKNMDEHVDSQTHGFSSMICDTYDTRSGKPVVCIDIPEEVCIIEQVNPVETLPPLIVLTDGQIEEVPPKVENRGETKQTKVEEVIDVETYHLRNSNVLTEVNNINEAGEKGREKRSLEVVEKEDQGTKRHRCNEPNNEIIVID